MAPTTRRSSTPNTTPVKSTAKSTSTTPGSGRKVPRCRTCHRPRAGHPRDFCPAAVSPVPGLDVDSESESEGEIVAEALQSMRIQQEGATSRRQSTTPRRSLADPAPSLASLGDSIIVERLLQPGALDDVSDEEARSYVRDLRFEDPQTKDKKSKYPHRGMPCTLGTPAASLTSAYDEVHVKKESFVGGSDVGISEQLNSSVETVLATTPLPRELVRSMSAEERDLFFQNLDGQAPSARVYKFPKADILAHAQSANKLGIASLVIGDDLVGSNEGYLILGKDEKAVRALKEHIGGGKGRGTGIYAAAGGAVAGAAATLTGLAYL